MVTQKSQITEGLIRALGLEEELGHAPLGQDTAGAAVPSAEAAGGVCLNGLLEDVRLQGLLEEV